MLIYKCISEAKNAKKSESFFKFRMAAQKYYSDLWDIAKIAFETIKKQNGRSESAPTFACILAYV